MAEDRTPSSAGAAAPADPAEAHRKLREHARRREDLLGEVSRDLRGPLEALGDGLSLLEARDAGHAELEAMREAVAALERLERSLEKLQSYARGGPELQREPVDLVRLCRELAVEPPRRTSPVVEASELPAFPVVVGADEGALREALSDALALGPSGRLTVDAGAGVGRVAFHADAPAEPEPGLALALALLRELAEVHGGAFDGDVAGWSLSLPTPAAQAASRSRAAEATAGARAAVLVVEDDESAREALVEALSDFYAVRAAADGVEGVEAARADRPDLVLMDLYMPRLDGFGALEALRADPATADVPVILVSGHGDDLTRAHSLDLGAVDFLQKPFSERELRARIDRTLRLARRQTQLQALAETDALTGLANRRAFRSRLAQEVSRARRYDTRLSCLMVDMDHLKTVNDVLGHAAGDRAIAAIAQVLQGELRETDFGARYGGDEFVLLLPHTTAVEGRVLAARLCDRLRATPFEVDGNPVGLSASFGVAELPDGAPEDAAEEMLRAADAALYAAKAAGRGRVAVQPDGHAAGAGGGDPLHAP